MSVRTTETLESLLLDLKAEGCYPSIYRRGPKIWRAHVNQCGNYWDDGRTPLAALRKAVKAWRKNGKPMDGEGRIYMGSGE